MINDEKEVVDVDNDGFVDKEPGLFYDEIKQKSTKAEEKVEDVKQEKNEDIVDVDNDGFVDKEPGLFYEEIKEETNKREGKVKKKETKKEEVKEGSDLGISNSTEEIIGSEETGKNIELANNIIKEEKKEETKNLPVDIKPFLDVVKEKLKNVGKVVTNILEMVGEMVEGIFKNKK